jgi:hypothetical protein
MTNSTFRLATNLPPCPRRDPQPARFTMHEDGTICKGTQKGRSAWCPCRNSRYVACERNLLSPFHGARQSVVVLYVDTTRRPEGGARALGTRRTDHSCSIETWESRDYGLLTTSQISDRGES